jgi:hypothetical protein
MVLVRGAFADASSWNGVVTMLEEPMSQPGRIVSETGVDAAKGPPMAIMFTVSLENGPRE